MNQEVTPRWLMRRIDDNQTLLFSVPVAVEETSDGLFESCVASMRDQMIGGGESSDEATGHALSLFMATVDDAIERGMSIHYCTGVQPLTLDIPFKDAPRFLHLLEQMENTGNEPNQWALVRKITNTTPEHSRA
jgi:hypothetical protein